MTADEKKHKCRCETCHNDDCGAFTEKIRKIVQGNDKTPRIPYESLVIYTAIEEIGCASHSSNLDDDSLTVAYMVGKEDGRKETEQQSITFEKFKQTIEGVERECRKDEREKVARVATIAAYEKAEVAIQERIDGIFDAYRGETNEKLTEHAFTMANGMGEAQKIVKSLRIQEPQK
jgi:hypothetical protein